MTTTLNLTLYSIETQLLELLIFRDSVLEDPDMTPQEQKDSLDAIDSSIQVYVTAEVKKCDGIARYLREFETRAFTLRAEAARCTNMAKAWEKRQENLENMVISIMQQTGATRIDGKHSVLSLRKNPPSVDVQTPNLVPSEYNRFTVTMTEALYFRIRNALQLHAESAPIAVELQHECTATRLEPMKQKIGEELKLGGNVPGCRLKKDSVRLEVK